MNKVFILLISSLVLSCTKETEPFELGPLPQPFQILSDSLHCYAKYCSSDSTEKHLVQLKFDFFNHPIDSFVTISTGQVRIGDMIIQSDCTFVPVDTFQKISGRIVNSDSLYIADTISVDSPTIISCIFCGKH